MCDRQLTPEEVLLLLDHCREEEIEEEDEVITAGSDDELGYELDEEDNG